MHGQALFCQTVVVNRPIAILDFRVTNCTENFTAMFYFLPLCGLSYGCVPVSSAQRSAQEFPTVERQDLDRCSVHGGQQMVLTGQNFTSDSKVVFSEKTQGEKEIFFISNLIV